MNNSAGAKIKIYRKKSKLTQTQLGRILNVAQSTVAMWETGESMPRAEKLPELAHLFGCSIDDLLISRDVVIG